MDLGYEARRIVDVGWALWLARRLARHDHWSREAILRYRQERLAALVRHAAARSEFYRELYRGIDLTGPIALQALPVIDKPLVMANFDRLVTDPSLKLADLQAHLRGLQRDSYYHGEYRVLATAGTSGYRGVFVFNRREWRMELANALRWHRLMGVSPRLFPRVKISAIGADSPLHVSARLTGSADVGVFKFQLLEATAPLVSLVAALNAFQPEVLLSYSSVAALLAAEQSAGRLRIRPRVISVHSELLTADMARKIETAWGIRPFNHYGLTELSTFSAECDRHCGMHMLDDLFIAEIVDDAFWPVAPNMLGTRLLLTNLYNYTQPLIRYDVSDMLALSPGPCACGRPFPLISAMAGRGEECLRLAAPDGREVVVTPLILSAAIESFEEIVEFQLQCAPGLVQARVVPRDDVPSASLKDRIARQLAERLRTQGAIPPRIEVELVSALDRSGGRMGKLKLVQFASAAVA
jgi:phenylacetate-coenzyme A ligase PaaK-like adenylate-forming protein